MALKEDFEKLGNWLFRWRSYLPLALTAVGLLGMREFSYPLRNHLADLLWEIFCLSVSLFGLGIRMYIIGHAPKGCSERNTRHKEAVVLNVTGLYSLVRHPLYLGNFFCWLGVSMFPRVWYVTVIFILFFILYYERIMLAEEEFLRRKFGDEFEKWADRTPAFIPSFKKWVPNSLPFSLRHVLKREYSGFFAIICCFTFLEISGDVIARGQLGLDPMWIVLFSGATLVYLSLRTLKKKTKILDVAGR